MRGGFSNGLWTLEGYKWVQCGHRTPAMLQKMFSLRVQGKQDMARFEEVVIGLLGGEHNRCAFLRSGEYQRFRNTALYVPPDRNAETFALTTVHLEGLKLTLTPTRIACVYVTDACVVPVPPAPATSGAIARDDEEYAISSLVGKKRSMAPAWESDDDDPVSCLVGTADP